MDEALVKNIVESLFSDEVNQKYLDMYLSDPKLSKQCDETILQMLEEDFSNAIFDGKKSLNYLNNAIKPQLKKKPYLSSINPVEIAAENYIKKIQDERFENNTGGALGPDNYARYKRKNNAITKFLNVVHSFKYDNIDIEAEERFANIYIQRIKNNNELSKDQVEELLAFTLMGGFILKHEEYTDKAFDYALGSILKNDYKIDGYLYKGLFKHSCKKILGEKGITNVSVDYARNTGDEMSYSDVSKTIVINEDELLMTNPIHNFMTFFHELRHYQQHTSFSENLTSFLIAKELYLISNFPREIYYKKNYHSLFLEKDANYGSYKDVYDFIKEKAPSRLNDTKKEIYESLTIEMLLQNRRITDRKIDGVSKDFNVIFEKLVRQKKKSYKDFNSFIKSPILIEYDIFGNKRSIFELLESKEFNEREGSVERAAIINYLLYEESVSLDYINENIKLLSSPKNKEKYRKYYKEAKKVIKHKIIRQRADSLAEKNVDNKSVCDYLKSELLREKKVKGLNQDKRVELYSDKDKELMAAYKWLYDFMKEQEQEKSTDKGK